MDLVVIGEVIPRQFGKRLTTPGVRRIMRLLGLTPQKPCVELGRAGLSVGWKVAGRRVSCLEGSSQTSQCGDLFRRQSGYLFWLSCRHHLDLWFGF